MNRITDSKEVYAQSSDIKSRTYLEYRADMKKKAAVELEIINWLENKLKELHGTDNVVVRKTGGDAYMWFLRSGKISGEPDYVACIDGEKQNFEFQYAASDDLPLYDFKVSKVGKKTQGKRTPHSDRQFLYVLMSSSQFAFFTPEWVMQNGSEEGVPAWGSRKAFRVPADKFKKLFSFDERLSEEIESINKKIFLLDRQSRFIKEESKILSIKLQNIVDQEKTFKIIPKTLNGFYETCFLMDKLNKHPENQSLWLVYGSSFFSDTLNSRELARLIYSLDFLYGGSDDLEKNVINSFVESMRKVTGHIALMQEQGMKTCDSLSPNEEIANFLFAVNLYEDIVQELRHLYGIDCFDPIRKIFQTINDLDSICEKF